MCGGCVSPHIPFQIMESKEIREDETLEDLQLNGLHLIQKKRGFRFGMDSVLLADFARIRPGDAVADFGCGTGILDLLMIGRNKGRSFVGIEIQSDIAEMAGRTMRLNELENRVKILNADVTDAPGLMGECSVEAVVCNPPYGMPGRVLKSQTESLATARHQQTDTLAGFFKAAFRLLKGKGRMFLVYPAPQMFSLMTELHRAHLEPKRFRLVYPDDHHPANLVLMEAVKDARPRLHPMPPLLIYRHDGSLTNELRLIYNLLGAQRTD